MKIYEVSLRLKDNKIIHGMQFAAESDLKEFMSKVYLMHNYVAYKITTKENGRILEITRSAHYEYD